jgi:DNA-directed RNA polymerase subunit RPC12/RpoP
MEQLFWPLVGVFACYTFYRIGQQVLKSLRCSRCGAKLIVAGKHHEEFLVSPCPVCLQLEPPKGSPKLNP